MSTSNAWIDGEACQLPKVPSLHVLNVIINIDSPELALWALQLIQVHNFLLQVRTSSIIFF